MLTKYLGKASHEKVLISKGVALRHQSRDGGMIGRLHLRSTLTIIITMSIPCTHNIHTHTQHTHVLLHQTKNNYTNLAEYRVALHAYARRGLESMLDSDQQCLTFRRTHLFNSENSRQINSSMLIDLNNYLDLVRTHLANISRVGHSRHNV